MKTLIDQIKEEKERHKELMQELNAKIVNNYRKEKATVNVCYTCRGFDREEGLCRQFGNIETSPYTMVCDDWVTFLYMGDDPGDPPNFRTTDQNSCINCCNCIDEGEHGFFQCKIMKFEPEFDDLYICDRYERAKE